MGIGLGGTEDRSRLAPAGAVYRRTVRRDGCAALVEHRGTAWPLRRQGPEARLSAHAPFRASAVAFSRSRRTGAPRFLTRLTPRLSGACPTRRRRHSTRDGKDGSTTRRPGRRSSSPSRRSRTSTSPPRSRDFRSSTMPTSRRPPSSSSPTARKGSMSPAPSNSDASRSPSSRSASGAAPRATSASLIRLARKA